MAEEITRTIENVDRLFSEIVVNGESHVSQRFNSPSPQSSTPSAQAQAQGEDVHAVDLNNVLHNFSDPDMDAVVQGIRDGLAGEVSARSLADQALSSDIAIEANARQGADNLLQGSITAIESKIPSQASAQNQLADKNFVNSSIATNTANFLGTYTSMADIEAIQNPTNNDYVFLQTTDASGNNLFDRYKYNAEQEEWLFEYELNNSSFTAEQWATINSGLTQSSVTQEIEDAIAGATIGHANEADKLSTARDLKVNLASANAQSFNGTANATSIGVAGTLPVGNGGTGQTSQADVNKAIIGNLSSGSSDVTDGTEFVSSYASDNGFSDTNALNVPYKRSFLRVWNYIKGKISSVLGLTVTAYGGKASTAGTADSAGKLTTARKVYVKLGTASTSETKDFSGDTAIPVNGTLGVANGGTGQTTLALARNAMGLGNTTGALPVANGGTGQTSLANVSVGSASTATSAGKLTTARKVYVKLGTASTTETKDFSGDTAIPVNGTLGVANGGTGQTSLANVSVGGATNATKLANIAVTTSTPTSADSGNCWAYITNCKITTTGGYIIYSNGFRILWGLHSNTGGDTTQTITFSSAVGVSFTQPPIVTVSFRRADSASVFWYALNVSNVSATAFKLGSHSTFDNNLKFCWIAMGY